jgi:hypothetical protein
MNARTVFGFVKAFEKKRKTKREEVAAVICEKY